MSDSATMRDRYLSDPLAIRLGGLAANLARIRSFSAIPSMAARSPGLVRESALFIEWTAR